MTMNSTGERRHRPSRDRQRVERHVGGIAGLEDAGFAVEHALCSLLRRGRQTRSIRRRPKMPSGRTISTTIISTIGREILGAAADIRVEIAGGEVLDDADDEPADHRAR